MSASPPSCSGPAVAPDAPRDVSRQRRHRARWWVAGLLTLLLAGAAGAVVTVADRLDPPPTELTTEEMLAPIAAGPVESPAGTRAGGSSADHAGTRLPTVGPAATTSVPTEPVLRLPGPVPPAGSGRFGYDDRPGDLLGRAGTLQRYRVAVETGSGEDVAAFGTAVQDALGAPESWIGSGRLRLQRVPASAPHDFTVYLATARTAARMCAAGGVNIRVGGQPYTSCRAPGKVIINLDRWRLSVPHFVSARVPLASYRAYVVNHEVGHQLGHRHERCPGVGRPAPVMMQQTLFLRGCVANPWPYRNGRRYAGPLL